MMRCPALPASLALLCCLSGCAGLQSMARTVAGPLLGPPAAPAAPAERTVALRLHAASRLNTDRKGQPLALVTRIYKLRQSAAFEQAPIEAFASPASERDALGADLVDAREVVLVPGQRYDVQEKVGPEVGYIGIVGLFHSPAPQHWRLAFASGAAQKSGITVGAHGCALAAGAGAPALASGSVPVAPCR